MTWAFMTCRWQIGSIDIVDKVVQHRRSRLLEPDTKRWLQILIFRFGMFSAG